MHSIQKITRLTSYKEKMHNSSAAHPVDAHAQNTEVNRISITILAVFRNLNGKDGCELDRRKSMRRKPRRPKRIR
jgi:hypothetical protein